MIRLFFTCIGVAFIVHIPFFGEAQQNSNRKKVSGISTDLFTEFAPTISADGSTMILESNRNETKTAERWELFESRKTSDTTWSDPVPITAINEKCNFVAGPSLSYDGNRIYFTAVIEGVNESEDIFYSDRLSETLWSEPISVGGPVNTEDYEGFPSISADGKSLYFIRLNYDNSVDKKSKETCFEIYVSRRQADGKWGEPEKLPEQINTGCVRDPRIMADNHTLIFSAITPNGKGFYDLYQSRKNPDGTWVDARPLDFINSEVNDQSPTISASGDVIFFMSNNDIYAMPVPLEYRQLINVTVQGYVRSVAGGGPVSANIAILNLATLEKTEITNSASDGRFSLILAAGSNFRVEFLNQSYLKEVRDFDLRKQETYKEIDIDIELKSQYQAQILPTDSDLKIPVTAHVKMTDQTGAPVWDDSVRVGQALSLKLDVLKRYEIEAVAQRYPMVKGSVVFDARIFKPDTVFNLPLVHERVKFAADVTDVATNKRVKTKVTFTNTSKDEVIIAESGEAVLLRKGDRYQVVASSDKGYFFSTTSVVAGDGEAHPDGSYRANSVITPIKEGALLTLDNITFETNSAELKTSSFAELDRVIELLHQNPSVVIEIAAHTDDVGNDDYNLKLSERRAQGVVAYLNKKGISNKRFMAKGYGKTKPLAPNDTDEARALNRRVELIILKLG